MRILAIVSRDLEKGSTKYRLAQYLDDLSRRGAEVEFVRRDAVDAATVARAGEVDVVFNQKCLLRTPLARRLIAASRKTVFDFDDAIYTRPGRPFSWLTRLRISRRLRLWLEEATAVTVPNEHLAAYARKFSARTEVVPMALDLETWRPARRRSSSGTIVGWAGAPVNIPLLERLDGPLRTLLERHPGAKLSVFSGRRPKLGCPFDYHPYREGAEPEFVAGLDIGLLPLADDAFAWGKSPIKALQYLACGVPVVGNVYGATAELVRADNGIAVSSEDEWVPALERLLSAPDLAASMGKAGRALVEERHDLRRVAERLWNILAEE